MPDVRNCKRCGKIYSYIGGVPLCPACKEQDEQDFQRVKNYLYDNPGASMSVISNELKIGVDKIKRFLKEGRLEILGDDGNVVLECEGCGKAIKTGRYCDACERDLSNGLKDAANKINQTLKQTEALKRSCGLKFLSKDEGKENKR